MPELMAIDWEFSYDGEPWRIDVYLVQESTGKYELNVRKLDNGSWQPIYSEKVTTGWHNAFGDKINPKLQRSLEKLERLITED